MSLYYAIKHLANMAQVENVCLLDKGIVFIIYNVYIINIYIIILYSYLNYLINLTKYSYILQ